MSATSPLILRGWGGAQPASGLIQGKDLYIQTVDSAQLSVRRQKARYKSSLLTVWSQQEEHDPSGLMQLLLLAHRPTQEHYSFVPF